MIFLCGYLGIGIATLALVYGAHLLTREPESESLRDLLEIVDPARTTLSVRILSRFIAPGLAMILLVAVWPLAVYLKAKEILPRKHVVEIEEEREFAVERQHLLERLTVQEAEKREFVIDPLGAVPERPFGHLHSAWKAFLDARSDGSELWSFSARWQTSWGRTELRSGYVLVRSGAPGAHFLTVWKDLPDHANVDDSVHRGLAGDAPGASRKP